MLFTTVRLHNKQFNTARIINLHEAILDEAEHDIKNYYTCSRSLRFD